MRKVWDQIIFLTAIDTNHPESHLKNSLHRIGASDKFHEYWNSVRRTLRNVDDRQAISYLADGLTITLGRKIFKNIIRAGRSAGYIDQAMVDVPLAPTLPSRLARAARVFIREATAALTC